MELVHGGDVTGYRLRYGRRPLDFSASLNPFGMPRTVRAAAKDAVDDSAAYPDPLCRELRAALARHVALPEECLFIGNGAADVIYRFVQAAKPRKALVPAPAFAEYERALASVGCTGKYHQLHPENGFQLEEDILAELTPDIDVVFLCQPNNPTGKLIAPALLKEIVKQAASVDAVVFLDECFCRFVDDWQTYSLVREVPERSNLFILDSFTKLYAMAGIRLGYGMTSDSRLLDRVYGAGQPWSVSTMAQAAGLAALNETEYVEHSLHELREAKENLVTGLRRFDFTVLGHDANYVFFFTRTPNLDRRLMEKGILIRNCGNFRGLENGYYRAAVRLPEENERLLQALATVVNG